MVDLEFSLFDKERDWLLGELFTFGSPDRDLQIIGDVSSAISNYRKRDLFSFLDVFTAENARRFSNLELENGIFKLVRYQNLLQEEISKLSQLYTGIYNTIQYQKEELQDLTSAAIFKIGALKLYSEAEILKTTFNFTDTAHWNIESPVSGYKKLTVAPNLNGATLPILTSDEIGIESVTIGNRSNGVPGDPYSRTSLYARDLASSLIDSDPSTYFRYSRRGSDGVTLELILSLQNESIVNALELELIDYPLVDTPVLTELHYETPDGLWAAWITSPNLLKSQQTIVLNPVKTKKVKLLFQCKTSEFTISRGSTSDLIQRSIMGIRYLKLLSNVYADKGAISSKRRENTGATSFRLWSLLKEGTVDSLSNVRVEALTSTGWQEISLEEDGGGIAQIEDENLELRVLVSVDREQFRSQTSTVQEASVDHRWIPFSYDPFSNPNKVEIGTRFLEKSIAALEELPYSMEIEEKELEAYEGEGSAARSWIIESPWGEETGDRIIVFFDGVRGSYDRRLSKPLTYRVVNSRTGTRLEVAPVGGSTKVTYTFRAESVHPVLRGDAYRYTAKNAVLSFRKAPILRSYSSDKKGMATVALGAMSLHIPDSTIWNVALETEDQTPYTLFEYLTPSDFFSSEFSSPSFTVLEEAGQVLFSQPVADYVSVKFTYRKIVDTEADIELTTLNEPRGVRIPIEDISTSRHVESISKDTARNKKRGRLPGSVPEFLPEVENTLSSNGKRILLSHQSVVQGTLELSGFDEWVEVPFINGVTELSTGTYGVVSATGVKEGDVTKFRIPGGEEVRPDTPVFPFEPSFFVKQVDTLGVDGDWKWDAGSFSIILKGDFDNLTVEVGVFFRNQSSTGKLYSVDYKNGVVFLSEPIEETEASYSCTSYELHYCPGRLVPVERMENGHALILRSKLSPSLPKYLTYAEPIASSDIRELSDYYTPVLKSLVLRVA